MRRFRRFRDDRFALTTLQNPNLEVRTYAELVQAAQQERENQPAPAAIPAAISATPPSPAPVVPCAPDSIPAAQFQEMDASTAPEPLLDSLLDSDGPEPAYPVNPISRNEAVQQLADLLGVSLAPDSPTESSTLPAVEADLTPATPRQNPAENLSHVANPTVA
jgi:hypothetical protein